MCQKCLDSLKEIFPDATKKECSELLWEHTSYPFGGPEQVREDLLQHRAELDAASNE